MVLEGASPKYSWRWSDMKVKARDIEFYQAQITLLVELLEELKDNPKKDEIMEILADCETMEEKLFYLLTFTS